MATIYYVDKIKGREYADELRESFEDPEISDSERYLRLAREYLKIAPEDIKAGDFMQLSRDDYRNGSAMIFDGINFNQLSSVPDDYGSIPEEFLIFDEFPLNHFRGILDHNDYVPFDQAKHRQKILDNLVRRSDLFWTSEFKIKGQPVKLLFFREAYPDEEGIYPAPDFNLYDGVVYYSYGAITDDFFAAKNNYNRPKADKDKQKYIDEGWLFTQVA